MKKRFTVWLLCLFLLLPLVMTAKAVETAYVIDNAQLLTDTERQELEARSAELAQQYQCSVHIVTVKDHRLYAETPEQAAVWFYEAYSMGCGEEQDGLVLLLSMSQRDYYLYARGLKGANVFQEDNLMFMEEYFLPYFADDNWYGGFLDYLDSAEILLSNMQEGDYASSSTGNFLVIMGGSLLVSVIVCVILMVQMKSVSPQRNAHAYMHFDPSRLTVRTDQFVRRSVSRRRIETNSGSRSGSSGGSRSAGRGGKF